MQLFDLVINHFALRKGRLHSHVCFHLKKYQYDLTVEDLTHKEGSQSNLNFYVAFNAIFKDMEEYGNVHHNLGVT